MKNHLGKRCGFFVQNHNSGKSVIFIKKNGMKTVDLKEKLHHVIDSAEPELLEILNSIAEKFSKNEEGLNPAQLEELKNRLGQFDSGKMKFFSWDEMMTQVKE